MLPELEDEVVVVALLGALGDGDDPAVLRPVTPGLVGGHPLRAIRARSALPRRDVRHLVDPVARGEHVVGVDVVGLPERAPVGRDREAAELDLVADDPRRHHHHRDHRNGKGRHPAGVPPEQEAREQERQHDQPGVRQDREAAHRADRGGRPEGAPRRREQRQPEQCRADQLVEDLAVPVQVVPDEIGLERRDHRSHQPDARRQEPPPDLEHDDRRRDRDQELREPDRPPVEAADPEDRDQEPAVERLRVGGGMARDVAERPVAEEHLCEQLRLLEVREDALLLVQEDAEPRQRARGDHDRIRPDPRQVADAAFSPRACYGLGAGRVGHD